MTKTTMVYSWICYYYVHFNADPAVGLKNDFAARDMGSSLHAAFGLKYKRSSFLSPTEATVSNHHHAESESTLQETKCGRMDMHKYVHIQSLSGCLALKQLCSYETFMRIHEVQ